MSFVREILDRIILVAAVLAAGCVPSFIAQYRQRVGGHLDQVLLDLAPFQQIANQFHHGSLQELIRHHLASLDPTFHNEGAAVQAMVDSAERLKATYAALDTDLLHQLGYLLGGGFDRAIGRATWDIFAPAFNLTPESVIFAVALGALVWLVFLGIWLGIGAMFTGKRKK